MAISSPACPPHKSELIKSNEATSVSFNQDRWAMERLLMLVPIISVESKRPRARGDTAGPGPRFLKKNPVSSPGARTTR